MAMNSITAEKGLEADAGVIWYHQVNRRTWIAMGAMLSNVICTEDGLMVDIYLGTGTRKRRLVIKLNKWDLYDIEIGHVHPRTLDWIPEAQTRDIYGDELDQNIRDLYDAINSKTFSSQL